jgi:hypothetical protein
MTEMLMTIQKGNHSSTFSICPCVQEDYNGLSQPSGSKGTAKSGIEGYQIEYAGTDGAYLLGFNQSNGGDHSGSQGHLPSVGHCVRLQQW